MPHISVTGECPTSHLFPTSKYPDYRPTRIVIPPALSEVEGSGAARFFFRAALWRVGPRSGEIAAHLLILRSSSWPPSVNSVFLSL
jgi:hypothetical protein